MPVAAVWLPYCGAAPEPAALLSRWNFDPILIAVLAIAAAAALRALPGRRERGFLIAGLGLALLLFVSPFCALTSALFAARSAHHVLLTAVLAPLLALAFASRSDSPPPGGIAGWTAASAITLWLWHAPSLYSAALSSDAFYWLMQASLAGTAFGFWTAALRSTPAAAVAGLLAYMVQMGLLGALLSFSTAAVYAPHVSTTAAWGLAPLEDQQLAGLIMWVPGALLYLAAALVLLRRTVSEAGEPAPA